MKRILVGLVIAGAILGVAYRERIGFVACVYYKSLAGGDGHCFIEYDMK
jgi:hypothetical protein